MTVWAASSQCCCSSSTSSFICACTGTQDIHRRTHNMHCLMSDLKLSCCQCLHDWHYFKQQRKRTHRYTHTHSRGLTDRTMMGSNSCPAPHQSRRSVTEGSSSASCDSMSQSWVMGLPRRSRRFSLGQEARGWRSATAEISVCVVNEKSPSYMPCWVTVLNKRCNNCL